MPSGRAHAAGGHQPLARQLRRTYQVTRSGAARVTVTPILSVVDMNTSASAGIVWEKYELHDHGYNPPLLPVSLIPEVAGSMPAS